MIGLVDRGSGLEGLVWGRVVAESCDADRGIRGFIMLKQALWPHRGTPLAALRGLRREILHFLVHMNLQGSLRAAGTKLDVLCVGVLAGPGSVGLYKVAVQLGSSPLLFADPLLCPSTRCSRAGRRPAGSRHPFHWPEVDNYSRRDCSPTSCSWSRARQLLSFLFGSDFAARHGR